MPQGHGLVWSNYKTVLRVWNNLVIPPAAFHSVYALFVLLCLQFPIFKILPLVIVISQLTCRSPKTFAALMAAYIALRYIPVHMHPAKAPVDTKDYKGLFIAHSGVELTKKDFSEYKSTHLLHVKNIFSAKTVKQFHKILGANTESSQPVHTPLMKEYNHWMDVRLVRDALLYSGIGKMASQLLHAPKVRLVGDAYKIYTTPSRSFQEHGYLKGDTMQKLLAVGRGHLGFYCPMMNAANSQLRFYDKNFIPARCAFRRGADYKACIKYLNTHQVRFDLKEGDCVVFNGHDIMHTILNTIETQEVEALFFFFAEEPSKFSGRVTYNRAEGRWSWCHKLFELHSSDDLTDPCTPLAYPLPSPSYLQQVSESVLLDFPMAYFKLWWLPHFFHFGDSMEVVLGFIGYLCLFIFCFFTMHRAIFNACVRTRVSKKKKRS